MLALSACDGSTPQAEPSPPLSSLGPSSAIPEFDPALCAAADALRTSLDALTNVTVGAGVAAELSTDAEAVKTNLANVVYATQGQLQVPIDALQSAIDGLEAAARSLADAPGADTVGAAQGALGEVRAAGQDLVAAVNRNCPKVSPAPSSR